MTPGFQALTEKEKESLRLLVDGHDAKSMARHLGLSVHTVNERLRDARRKMEVSSSREAARQLREIEGQVLHQTAAPHQTPQLSGYRSLGDAPTGAGVGQLRMPAASPRMLRRFGWVIAGVFMSFSLALLALSSLSGTAQAPAEPQSAPPRASAAEKAAVEAARAWLALTDAEDWNGSWDATGQAFKSLNTSERWAEVAQSVRTPLGAPVSRKLISVEYVPAPPYGYQMVKFQTDYANKADAIETVSLSWENESWRVVGVTVE